MSEQKQRPSGHVSALIGLAAGFAFLIALFQTFEEDWGRSEALTWVAITTTAISIFLVLTDTKKRKRCPSTRPSPSSHPPHGK